MLEFIMGQIQSQGECFVRLMMACLLGGAIGFERKNRNKGAGMRTHALVCLGAALVMEVSKYGFSDIPNYDASRVAAQVVSGIGFLGAGVIFVKNNAVSGLTTAAGIWVTSGVGLSIGAGQYFLATAAAVLMISVQVMMHNIKFLAKEPYRSGLRVVIRNHPLVVEELEKILKKEKIDIVSLKVNKTKGEDTKLELEIIYPAGYHKMNLINQLSKEENVLTVRG